MTWQSSSRVLRCKNLFFLYGNLLFHLRTMACTWYNSEKGGFFRENLR